MPSAIQWGIAAALGCALLGNVAALIKYAAVQDIPRLELSRPWQSTRLLVASRAWRTGFMLAGVGFLLNAVALKLAPISLVKPILAGGIVMLALLAERMLGLKPGTRQIGALILAGGGLIVFALTAQASPARVQSHGLVWFEAAAILLVLAVLSKRRTSASWLGVAAGLLMGSADVAIKQMGATSLSTWFSGPLFFALLGALAALLISAKALQTGEAVGTVALIGVTANLTAVLAGYVIFRDPLPSSVPDAIMHLGSLLAVLLALLLVPNPRSTG